ncbi:MAG: glutathione S-transferase family protein [Rhizobium sp.]|nr:glutathione S-transferase family protein [Rhizobium sp.]
MIRLYDYHLDENGFRVRLLLSMLGLSFETVAVDKAPGREQEKPHMLALNPTGTLPILEDGDVRLFGTAAILAYLAKAYAPDSPWLPADAADFGRVQQWLGFSGRELKPAVDAREAALFTSEGANDSDLDAARKAFRIMNDHMTLRQIEDLDWFVGANPTLADLVLLPSFALSRDFSIDHDEYPALRRWLRRFRALPGFITMPGVPDYH